MRKEFIIAIILIAFLGIGGLYFFLKPSSPSLGTKNTASPTPTIKQFKFTVKNGKIIPETKQFSVKKGDVVEFTITSDLEDELHLHGYDKTLLLYQKKAVKLMFTADTSGSFPLELHKDELEIGTLIVEP